jgi:predicted Zn-dependent peptidase
MKRKLAGLLVLSASSLLACDKTAPDTLPPEATQVDASEDASDVLARSDLPELVESPLPGDPMAATVHRLSNGMTVYISTDRQKPRFNAWIAVRTGGRNDPPDSTGLAHYLEHMLFKGTDELGTLDMESERQHVEKVAELYDRLRDADEQERERLFLQIDAETQAMAKAAIPNEFDNLYATLGINGVNAFTNEDATVYISNVPSNRLDAWARVEAERFQDPVFRLFYPELEAVYEEKNRSVPEASLRNANRHR